MVESDGHQKSNQKEKMFQSHEQAIKDRIESIPKIRFNIVDSIFNDRQFKEMQKKFALKKVSALDNAEKSNQVLAKDAQGNEVHVRKSLEDRKIDINKSLINDIAFKKYFFIFYYTCKLFNNSNKLNFIFYNNKIDANC